MKKKYFISLVALLIVVIFFGIIIYAKGSLNEDNNKNTKVKISEEEGSNNLSAWAVYWDLPSENEIQKLNNNLKAVSYFAANYDSKNDLVMPDQLINYYKATKNNNYLKYLTIVNDKTNADGSSTQKDVKLLKDLLSDEASRSKNIDDIINLAMQYKFDGIEIDYEKIKNDMDLWNNYIEFINELYNKCNSSGLKLRVVLEASAPFNKLNFGDGPTYVMMCYNLHGGFSEPGGKADPEFIEKLITSAKKVPGNKEFAIATGGFDWLSNGKTNSLTAADAVNLLKKYNAKAQRDSKSQCLYFNYLDEDNISHEVWYADKVTLQEWMEVIKKGGFHVSLWRLGGNLFEE